MGNTDQNRTDKNMTAQIARDLAQIPDDVSDHKLLTPMFGKTGILQRLASLEPDDNLKELEKALKDKFKSLDKLKKNSAEYRTALDNFIQECNKSAKDLAKKMEIKANSVGDLKKVVRIKLEKLRIGLSAQEIDTKLKNIRESAALFMRES